MRLCKQNNINVTKNKLALSKVEPTLICMGMKRIRKMYCGYIARLVLPVNSKGALLVLLWSTVMFIYLVFMADYVSKEHLFDAVSSHMNIHTQALYVALPTYLIIGLVADICVGRYKIIVASIYCAFIGWITLCVSFYVTHEYVHYTLIAVGYLLSYVGAAGILSIAIPFTIDQMIGATADELSTIIFWHIFGYPLATSLPKISKCLIACEEYKKIIGLCTSGVAITIVMVTYYLLRHHLDTTSLLTNPVKLIVKVLNYARKNKYPRNRSALTYWEESAPSRIDLGKDKYGGPFTEEEVEDVKTFFRYLPLLVCLFGVIVVAVALPSLHVSNNIVDSRGYCILHSDNIMYLILSILLGTYKIVFSKHCYKYVPSMRKRIGLGLCLLLLCVIVLVAMDLQDYNTANNCTPSHIVYNDTTTIDYVFVQVSQIICDIGTVTVIPTSLELTVAQSPVHMRGLMVGVWYGAMGVFGVLSYAIRISYTIIHSHCALYYHVTVSVCVLVTISVYAVLAKCYKLRTRNDPVNIPHIVATVYERYIEQSQQYRQLHGGSETLTYESVED